MRRVLIVMLFGFLCAGCANQGPPPDTALLDFIVDGRTTREQALLQLGQPSGSFESDRILTYRIGGNSRSGFVVRNDPKTWYMTNFSLVLVFDDTGVLDRHSLVSVQ